MWICNISLYRQRVNLCFARRTKIERHASLHSREISRRGRKDKTRNRRRRDRDDVGEVESFRDTSDISVRQFASRSANDAHYLCNGVFRLFDSLQVALIPQPNRRRVNFSRFKKLFLFFSFSFLKRDVYLWEYYKQGDGSRYIERDVRNSIIFRFKTIIGRLTCRLGWRAVWFFFPVGSLLQLFLPRGWCFLAFPGKKFSRSPSPFQVYFCSFLLGDEGS